jgi:hypothetical protein
MGLHLQGNIKTCAKRLALSRAGLAMMFQQNYLLGDLCTCASSRMGRPDNSCREKKVRIGVSKV